jgi:hypothetical protein
VWIFKPKIATGATEKILCGEDSIHSSTPLTEGLHTKPLICAVVKEPLASRIAVAHKPTNIVAQVSAQAVYSRRTKDFTSLGAVCPVFAFHNKYLVYVVVSGGVVYSRCG